MAANWLPHEMTHSWNGKFRRPSGLATADYSESKGDLLWVYEGLTDYVGRVLASRSGLRIGGSSGATTIRGTGAAPITQRRHAHLAGSRYVDPAANQGREITTLNSVQPYDWGGHRRRMETGLRDGQAGPVELPQGFQQERGFAAATRSRTERGRQNRQCCGELEGVCRRHCAGDETAGGEWANSTPPTTLIITAETATRDWSAKRAPRIC